LLSAGSVPAQASAAPDTAGVRRALPWGSILELPVGQRRDALVALAERLTSLRISEFDDARNLVMAAAWDLPESHRDKVVKAIKESHEKMDPIRDRIARDRGQPTGLQATREGVSQALSYSQPFSADMALMRSMFD
jgi:hypothetical protein